MLNMIAGIVIPISVTLAVVFCGMWKGASDYSKALQHAVDEYEDNHKEDFEKLEKRYKEDLARYKKMALDAAERADRNGAMAEGLAEDLAALKAYNPEETEERLKKIREIRADEERNEQMKREAELFRLWAAQSLMTSQYCSLGAMSQIPLQSPLNVRMTPGGHYIDGHFIGGGV